MKSLVATRFLPWGFFFKEIGSSTVELAALEKNPHLAKLNFRDFIVVLLTSKNEKIQSKIKALEWPQDFPRNNPMGFPHYNPILLPWKPEF